MILPNSCFIGTVFDLWNVSRHSTGVDSESQRGARFFSLGRRVADSVVGPETVH